MTAVASFGIANLPFMVADLLLSTDARYAPNTLELPTAPDVQIVFPGSSPIVPCGMRQKIDVIDGDLVLGWAGSARQAKQVLASIRRENKKQKLSCESLNALVVQLDKELSFGQFASSHDSRVDLIGWLREGLRITPFSYGAVHFPKSKRFHHFSLIGSGAQFLWRFLVDSSPIRFDSEASKIAESYVLAESTIAHLLAVEMSTLSTMPHFFGGGYEMVILEETGFKKVDGATFIFFGVEIDDGTSDVSLGQWPLLAFRFGYQSDALVIQKGVFNGEQSCVMTATTVSPAYRELSEEERNLSLASLNSQSHNICFVMARHGMLYNVLTTTECVESPGTQQDVRFETDGDISTVCLGEGFHEWAMRKILEDLKRRGWSPGEHTSSATPSSPSHP